MIRCLDCGCEVDDDGSCECPDGGAQTATNADDWGVYVEPTDTERIAAALERIADILNDMWKKGQFND